MRWGFVGLGQMGLPMARRLSAAVDLLAYDPAVPRDDVLMLVADPRDLARCDVLVTCLPDGDVVDRVLLGPGGIAQDMVPGSLVIDTSTTSHAAALHLHDSLQAKGIGFLDAPVSGMQARAEAGTLTMMVGGDAAALDPLRDALGTMANRILHMGPVGSGQLSKLVNQLLFNINMAGLAEIMPIAARMGLDPDRIAEVVNSGTGRSFASEFFLPNILQDVFDQGYPLQAAFKDMKAAADLTVAQGLSAPVLAAATDTYRRALAMGLGDQDKGAMIKVFERGADVRFRSPGHGGSDPQG